MSRVRCRGSVDLREDWLDAAAVTRLRHHLPELFSGDLVEDAVIVKDKGHHLAECNALKPK